MPFGVLSMSEQRISFVLEILQGELSLSAICRKHDISRPTAYKWLDRYKAGEAMDSRSKSPQHRPRKTGVAVEEEVLRCREAHPFWGGRKLKAYLERRGEVAIPSASTITAILHRHGLISKEASRAATPYKRFVMKRANDLWQTDFKGHFPMGDGNRCHPLTVTDDMSRFSLCISAKLHERFPDVRDSFLALFREYGLPRAVLSDNGPPFGACKMIRGFSMFDVFLMDYGIFPVHGRAWHPQTQGKAERFHRTLKRELLSRVIFENITDAQQELDAFRRKYNEERPHSSLDYAVPADKYVVSARKMPAKIAEWEYDDNCRVLKIDQKGYVRFEGKELYLSETLATRRVAMVETQDDGVVDIIYRNFTIATIDLRNAEYILRKVGRIRTK
jgi:transposase InsO family protein